MGNKLLYALLFGLVKIHALLPFRALYIMSDILYFFTYRVFRYRRKTVAKNLSNSFPTKTPAELAALERRFYHHFTDIIVETVKLAHISKKDLLRRVEILNPDIFVDLIAQGHTCFIITFAHYGNWEWFTGLFTNLWGNGAENKLYFIYRPLSNKAFDRLFLYLRTRFSTFGIKKNSALRDIINIKRSGEPSIVGFVADQTPSKANIHYRTQFLNQDTAFFTGPERIARKLDLPVAYGDFSSPKRGHYRVEFKLIADKPKETPEFGITEQFARLCEETIIRYPAFWLWTHKRWKHQPN